MIINYNVTGSERKRLVTALSDITGVKAKYLGMPSMAYEVDSFIIDKNGGLEFSDKADSEKIENVAQCLAREGFIAEEQIDATEGKQTADSEALNLCVSVPRSIFTEKALENLKAIVEAKGDLIRHALEAEDLPIEISEDEVSFPWFNEIPTPEEVKAYNHFISALCEMARNQKRITAKEKKSQMKNTHLDAFCSALDLLAKNIKKNEKYCSEI